MPDECLSNALCVPLGVVPLRVHTFSSEHPVDKLVSAYGAAFWNELVYVQWFAISDRTAKPEANADLVQQCIISGITIHDRRLAPLSMTATGVLADTLPTRAPDKERVQGLRPWPREAIFLRQQPAHSASFPRAITHFTWANSRASTAGSPSVAKMSAALPTSSVPVCDDRPSSAAAPQGTADQPEP